MRTKLLHSAALISFLLPAHAMAQDYLYNVGDSLSGSESRARGVSADGLTIIGDYDVGGGTWNGFIWSEGTFTPLSTLGGSYSYTHEISADGSIIAGTSEVSPGVEHAFRWQNGVMTDIGTLGGSGSSSVNGMSADGSVLAGTADAGAQYHAYRWQNGAMTDLGTLGGIYSYATGLSRDGSTVIGDSYLIGGQTHGFVWQSGVMTDLGTLGGTSSYARSVSDDGSVVAGTSNNGVESHAFVWQSGVMTDLGTLGGNDSHMEVHNLSGDGTVAGGVSTTAGGEQHAFRWESGVMSDLGTLGGTSSGTTFVSQDGTVLLGYAQNVGGDYLYFRWDQTNGMKSLKDILTTDGIDLTGWDLQAYGDIYLSDNNKIITGTAQLNGVNTTFIMTDHAITTPQEFVASVVPAAAAQAQIQSTINVTNDQSMMASRQALASFVRPVSFNVTSSSAPSDLNNIPSAAGPDSGSLWDDHKFSAYVLGSWGIAHGNDSGNNSGTGTAGFFYKVGDNLALGAGFIGGISHQDWRLGGDSELNSYGGSLNLAYEGDQGIRVFGMASASKLDIDTNRHYMNGAGIDTSHGNTNGMSYGASLETGYEFALNNQFSLMPYASYEVGHATIDGYTELGGGFPAIFDSQSSTKHIGRLGTELSFKADEDMKITARAAWAHTLHETGDDLDATVIGISQTVPFTKGEQDWAETGLTLNWNYTDDIRFIADAGTVIGNTNQPVATLTLGVTFGF